MNPPRTGALGVPGACLHYQVRGSGPFLLILQGGDGDADASDGLAGQLEDSYTIVTYDRRGLSRTTLDEEAPPPGIATHTDDAHHLLTALTTEPAYVLGTSIGALIGLELASRHAWQVRTLVAHEPPVLQLMSGSERAVVESALEEIDEAQRRGGVLAAIRKTGELLQMDFSDREADAPLPQAIRHRAANLEFFRKYDAPAAHSYQPDIAALKTTTARIVIAVGRTSRGIWPHRAAEVLADCLGQEVVEFPGAHNGFVLHPRAFAARLREVITGTPGDGRG